MGTRDRIDGPARLQKPQGQTSSEVRFLKAGLELRGKHPVGRDPREMTREELREMGHEPMSPLQAIRAHCLDCCVDQEKEVALYTAVKCPSWPFRMGTDPWRKPASPARREAARRTMTALNARRRERTGARSAARPPEHGAAPSLAEGPGAALSGIAPAPTRPEMQSRPGLTATALASHVRSW
jgi:hypothetical protein